jgi:hypothetical protein
VGSPGPLTRPACRPVIDARGMTASASVRRVGPTVGAANFHDRGPLRVLSHLFLTRSNRNARWSRHRRGLSSVRVFSSRTCMEISLGVEVTERNICPRQSAVHGRMLGVVSDATTGDDPMTEHTSGDPNAVDRLVRLDDGDMHVAEEGNPDAPGKSTTPAGKAGYAITAQARRGRCRLGQARREHGDGGRALLGLCGGYGLGRTTARRGGRPGAHRFWPKPGGQDP